MQKPVLVETSARHVHVSRRVLNILFGEGYELTHKKDLSQPGQFACEERVQVIGPKSSFPAVSILGPVRPETQVELSAGDARAIGVKAPIRESGDVKGSAPCKLVGPAGEVEIDEGVIIAKKHGGINETITVRRIAYNVGYEKVFPIHSPNVVSIDTIRRGKVRRAKLYYLRDRVGKQAKVKEKL